MKVVFRPEAEIDLIEIALYIGEDDVRRAQTMVARLRKRSELLSKHPEAGRPRKELGEDLRGLFERPYLLLYRILPDAVEIVAILHAARDLPSALAARVRRSDG